MRVKKVDFQADCGTNTTNIFKSTSSRDDVYCPFTSIRKLCQQFPSSGVKEHEISSLLSN